MTVTVSVFWSKFSTGINISVVFIKRNARTYFVIKIVNCLSAAGPESRGHSRTAWLNIDVKLLPKFRCSLDS
jgi:hypothetical protein